MRTCAYACVCVHARAYVGGCVNIHIVECGCDVGRGGPVCATSEAGARQGPPVISTLQSTGVLGSRTTVVDRALAPMRMCKRTCEWIGGGACVCARALTNPSTHIKVEAQVWVDAHTVRVQAWVRGYSERWRTLLDRRLVRRALVWQSQASWANHLV